MPEQPGVQWRFVDGGVVELAGEIDEHASLGPLVGRLKGAIVLDLAGIRRVNSQGVRIWIDFLAGMKGATSVRFRRCSPAVITQINMIANFRGSAQVESFCAPYVCEECGAEVEHLIEVADHRKRGGKLPGVACPKCGAAMSFDDVVDRYLSFLE